MAHNHAPTHTHTHTHIQVSGIRQHQHIYQVSPNPNTRTRTNSNKVHILSNITLAGGTAGTTSSASNTRQVQVQVQDNHSTAEILHSLSLAKVFSNDTKYRLVQDYNSSTGRRGDNNIIHNHGVQGQVQGQGQGHSTYSHTRPRHLFGDPATLNSGDDIVGTEERPSPSPSDSDLPYHYMILKRVMLDHTYAVTPQVASEAGPAEREGGGVGNVACPAESVVASPPSQSVGPPLHLHPLPPPPVNNIVRVPSRTEDIGSLTGVARRDDDAASVASSVDGDDDPERHDSDTETAPETEEDGKTRCVCDFTHDDGYMICCDRCGEWQHVDCMAIDRQNIPDDYMCDRCQPRLVNRERARSIQMRKREELSSVFSSASDSSSVGSADLKGKRSAEAANLHKRTFTTYSRTIGGVSRAISSDASPHSLSPIAGPSGNKSMKRPKRVDNGKKVIKKKSPEKKLKRKSVELKNSKSKYSSVPNSHRPKTNNNDPYELAMTNHYSPELRARVVRYCSNGTNSPTSASVLTAHHCATVPHAGSKILVATKDLKENSPIVELRGKYMLSDQHRPQPSTSSSGRTGNQRPGPFLFFYRLLKESTRVCVDTRTYGNEARFVRRSCKPNAELQHCVIKGTLHIYLVATDMIHADTEITIKHDDDGNSQPCACGNPKFCKNLPNKSNSLFEDHVHDKKGRTRLSNSAMAQSSRRRSPEKEIPEPPCFSPKLEKFKSDDRESISEAIKQDLNEIFANIKEELPEKEAEDSKIAPKEEPVKVKDVKMEVEPVENHSEEADEEMIDHSAIKKEDEKEKVIDLKCNEVMDSPKSKEKTVKDLHRNKESEKSKTVLPSRRSSTNSVRTTRSSAAHNTSESADEKSDSQSDSKSSKEKKVLSREERKMEAIMKAIERMEKAEQRRQENRDRQSKRRESESKDNCNDDNFEPKSVRKKKGRTQSGGQNQLNRNRMNSMDSDALTSGDENSSLLLSPTRDNFKKGSELMSPVHDSNSLDNSLEKMNVGLSSACLLVEAAVGPLETTFKLPKTKKTIMNEWLNKSPDINASYDQNQTENSSTIDNNNSSHHFVDKESFVGPKSMENLVKAANTMIGNMSGGVISVDSTPEKNYDSGLSESEGSPTQTQMSYVSRITRKILKDPVSAALEKPKTPKKNRKVKVEDRFTTKRPLRSSANRDLSPVKELSVSETVSNDTNVPHPLQHSAKKRWLRQAISEESDSPTAESPPNEMLTPLKKRRLARESLSLETSSISLESTNVNSAQNENEECHRSKQISDVCNSETPIVVNNCSVERLAPKVIENLATIPEIKENHIDQSRDVEMKPADDASQVKTNCSLANSEKESATIEKVSENSPIKSVTHSTETSGNSSPMLDEMDDIQKKIHSFHTENIQILKIRNKKQPKEKRKKVNLNFDLCVLDDQTVSVKLKDENNEENMVVENKIHLNTAKSTTDIEMKDAECEKLLNHLSETNAMSQNRLNNCDINISEKMNRLPEPVVNNNSTFKSTPLFLDSFRGESQVNDKTALVPDLDAIKNAIDKTTNLDTTIFENHLNSMDEYRNVQEILIRVNQMDSRNSVLLSGVLKDANHTNNMETVKNFTGRQSDPRLNHPPPEKPKPTKRKLSIYEYRRRQSMASVSSLDASDTNATSDVSQSGQDSTSDTHRTPSPREEINCSEKDLSDSVAELSRLSGISEGHSAKLMSSALPSDIMGHDSNDVSSYSLYSSTNCINSQINLDR